MSRRDHLLLLEDMLESCHKIKEYVSALDFDNFLNDSKTKDAVIRNFEIIGEAANRIEDEFKNSHPEIPWNRLRGFRNRVIHEYFGVDYEIVWAIITEDLDELTYQLKEVIKE